MILRSFFNNSSHGMICKLGKNIFFASELGSHLNALFCILLWDFLEENQAEFIDSRIFFLCDTFT